MSFPRPIKDDLMYFSDEQGHTWLQYRNSGAYRFFVVVNTTSIRLVTLIESSFRRKTVNIISGDMKKVASLVYAYGRNNGMGFNVERTLKILMRLLHQEDDRKPGSGSSFTSTASLNKPGRGINKVSVGADERTHT